MTKKLKVQILQRARKLIEANNDQYICDALIDASENCQGLRNFKATQDLRALISSRLEGCFSLEGWLIKNYPELGVVTPRVAYETRATDQIEKMKITRLAWIDSLIEEFS